MHFTKKEQVIVANDYNLGKVVSCKLIAGGLVNYNYHLTTNKGNFIVRFLTGHSSKDSKKAEFSILSNLNEHKFPYEIPTPLKNKSKRYISKLRGTRFWVYVMLDGNKPKNTPSMRRELAICNAKLNVFLKKIKGKKDPHWAFTVKKVMSQFELLKRIRKNKTKVDKLFFPELDFMQDLATKLGDKERVPAQWIHTDIYFSNVLGRGRKITGILDFDNLVYFRRTFDIASTLCSVCTRNGKLDGQSATNFMRAYERISPLNKKERDALVREMLRVQVVGYLWLYVKMKKFPQRKYALIKDTINLSHDLADIEWPSN